MFGIEQFVAVINPRSCDLAVGATLDTPGRP